MSEQSTFEEEYTGTVRLSLLSTKKGRAFFATFSIECCPAASRDFFFSKIGLRDGEAYEVLRRFHGCSGEVFEIEVSREPSFHDDQSYSRVYVNSAFFRV